MRELSLHMIGILNLIILFQRIESAKAFQVKAACGLEQPVTRYSIALPNAFKEKGVVEMNSWAWTTSLICFGASMCNSGLATQYVSQSYSFDSIERFVDSLFADSQHVRL